MLSYLDSFSSSVTARLLSVYLPIALKLVYALGLDGFCPALTLGWVFGKNTCHKKRELMTDYHADLKSASWQVQTIISAEQLADMFPGIQGLEVQAKRM